MQINLWDIFNNYLNYHNSNIKNKLNLIFNANSTENESDFDSVGKINLKESQQI